MKERFLAAFFYLLFFPIAPDSAAQTVGGLIRGVVTAEGGKGQPDANVLFVNEGTNERRLVLTGPDGEYTLPVLRPGSYRMEVELTGFRKYVRKGIGLLVDQNLILNVDLEPGQLGQEIVVTATLPLVRQDDASVGMVIENRQIVDLPLDGRNFLELSLLVPGTAPAAPGSPGSIRGEFSVNVNGAREDANNFLLDGVYNGDPKLNTFALNPPVDAIREFEILANSYDASFGRSAGAQVNVALKSGTNKLHGTIYEFVRNASLDARNFFSRSEDGVPQYQRNQFGFSLGGPIRRDRTFFFSDYEGRRLREGITRVTNVPDARERAGDFSLSDRPAPVDPFTGQPFPGNRIPASRLHPIGKAMAALYPLPNRFVPGQNFVSSPALRDRDDRFDVRLDHSLKHSSALVARYSFADRTLYEPFSGPTFSLVPGYGTDVFRRAQNLMIGENHTFSSSLINEIRAAFNRVAFGALHENRRASVNRSLGLPELSADSRDHGLSFITITGFSPLGDEFNNPQHSITNIFQVLDYVTLVRRNHLFKFGFDFRSLQQNGFRDVQSRGFLTFSDRGQVTGSALADMLLGYPFLTGGARLDNPQYLRIRSLSFFFQDSYRVRRNLSVLVGVRYEHNSPPVDKFDRSNVYDPETQKLAAVGKNGVPRGGYAQDGNNWAPRIGLAWSPFPDGRTVVHAGYGIYYDQSSLAPGEGLYFNKPYFDFNLYFPLQGLPLTLENPFPSSFPFPLPDSALGFQRDLRTAYFQHWNLKLQREFGANQLGELAYVGTKGTRILAARDLNQPAPGAALPNLRPVPSFDDITFEESRGSSSFHSLQARFHQRFHAGISVLAAYTWAKSLDDTSTFFPSAGDANFPQDSRNLAAEKGRSNFDVRQRVSVSYSQELPMGRGRKFFSNLGWLSSALSGWNLHEIVSYQTGRPFTVALPAEADNSNTGRSSLGFGANDRPHRLASGRLSNPTPERWFDTSAFAYPAFGSFGNSGRNILDGPRFCETSISLAKDTFFKEELRLQFRIEVFNLWNNVNFDLPDIFVGSPGFGSILSAQSPRRIQFGLKLIF